MVFENRCVLVLLKEVAIALEGSELNSTVPSCPVVQNRSIQMV